jgi:hypothetical protein
MSELLENCANPLKNLELNQPLALLNFCYTTSYHNHTPKHNLISSFWHIASIGIASCIHIQIVCKVNL